MRWIGKGNLYVWRFYPLNEIRILKPANGFAGIARRGRYAKEGKRIRGEKGNEKKDCIIRCTCFPVLNVYTGGL